MSIKKSTPVLCVSEVEPCVDFWARLGLTKTVEVPVDGKLVFVVLQSGTVEIMYQTIASVAHDNPHAGEAAAKGPTFLYIEVDDLAATRALIPDLPLWLEERTTFYGAKEFGVNDPGGHFITFAQMGA